MAGKGKRFLFHGGFKSKAAAVRQEKRTPHSFILAVKDHGRSVYDVLTIRKKRS